MNRLECERWASLTDRASAGDQVDASEQAFVQQHPNTCVECAREARAWAALAELPGPVQRGAITRELTDLLRERLASGISRSAEPAAAREHPAKRRRLVRRGWWAPLAAAAVATLAFHQLTKQPVTVSPRFTLLMQSGTQAGLGERLEVGSVVRAEAAPTCFAIEPGIVCCLAAGGELRVGEQSATSKLLELRRGTLVSSLAPQPSGSHFSVKLGDSISTAVGTLFAVQAGVGGSGVTRVARGKVEVRLASGALQAVHAGQAVAHDDGRVRAMQRAETDADLSLARISELLESGRTATLVLEGAPGEIAALDGAELGMLPLSVLVRPGAHSLELRSGDATKRELLDLRLGERFHRHQGSTHDAAPPAAPEPTPAPEAAESPKPRSAGSAVTPADKPYSTDALKAAAELRSNGKFAEAAKAFAALQREHPGSAAAAIGLASAAELELTKLGKPAAALAHYEQYLGTGHGGLAREATYGKISALKALGRSAEEARALEAALTQYPSDARAVTWKARLDALRSGSR